ncbi:PilZ domain-containing protein [Allochromatium palmeri]|uniref:PilZ domain-containing protein n=1 Tax=Allochromatium palmeri TaxID=231048 RepID=A0A6N8EFI1_9GAMM|nr:PilZ domain-containing protein [Allochromatium palmeri]MTW22290.1 hypothetical protein [Allochromatium palmeri]
MPNLISPAESERRTQARLRAQVPIQLRISGKSPTHPATLIDLSWGGALCQTSTALQISDQPLWLLLPWTLGETIEIETTLLRQKNLENGRHLLAMRFLRLSLSNQTRLEKLLGQLQAGDSRGGTYNAPSLVATLEVLIQTLDEWRWALSAIAKGRLRISAPATFTPGQSLGLQFNGVPARARLRLRARVLACEAEPIEGMGAGHSDTLTLEFEHPLNILRQWAEWLLGQVPPNSQTSSLPAAYQPQTVRPEVIPARVVLTQHERSALEISFPEALDYLMTAWGDVSAFELVFRQLIFGDTSIAGTWTLESWEELQLLQDVHDQAYGVSDARRSQLKVGRDVH